MTLEVIKMTRRSRDNDHIDFDKLLDLIHEVEDCHDGSVMSASDKEMTAIWEIAKIPRQPGRHKIKVTQQQYWIIESYSRAVHHTIRQKESVLTQLGENYGWLVRMLHRYRLGDLEVTNEI